MSSTFCQSKSCAWAVETNGSEKMRQSTFCTSTPVMSTAETIDAAAKRVLRMCASVVVGWLSSSLPPPLDGRLVDRTIADDRGAVIRRSRPHLVGRPVVGFPGGVPAPAIEGVIEQNTGTQLLQIVLVHAR